jgi:hypothetical protein
MHTASEVAALKHMRALPPGPERLAIWEEVEASVKAREGGDGRVAVLESRVASLQGQVSKLTGGQS